MNANRLLSAATRRNAAVACRHDPSRREISAVASEIRREWSPDELRLRRHCAEVSQWKLFTPIARR